jgi:hypothetical protein
MTAILNEPMDMTEIGREEMEGLTAMMAEGKKSVPLKISYDNICVHEFETGMKMNPRTIFNSVLEHAEKKIDAAVIGFESKDTSKTIARDAWQIKNKFLTIDICLHCYTEYEQSNFSHEDISTHRVVVSMIASFDVRKVYRTESHSTKVFKEVNDFHIALKNALVSEQKEK